MTMRGMERRERQDAPCPRWLVLLGSALLVLMTTGFLVAGVLSGCAFADGLSVEASAPEDGASKVPTKGEFWVEFDHNVAAVAGNVDCVSLQTASGKKVSSSKWSVELPDEQLEFGLRKHVIIKVKGLDAGKKYRIHLAAGLAAKNGASLGSDTDISFTTAAKGAKAASLAQPEETAAGSGNGNGTGGNSASAGSSGSDSVGTSGDSGKGSAGGSTAGNKEDASSSDSEGSAAGSSSGAGMAPEYVDSDAASGAAEGQDVRGQAVPVAGIVIVVVLALAVIVGWILRWRKANANAPKRK